ncbi:MAG: sigma-54-dependent Fis family transcriptional regulator [Halomonas sp.]|nr:sigma-54-dependent Fis family transcriptional regulator [Halomonas sp.]
MTSYNAQEHHLTSTTCLPKPGVLIIVVEDDTDTAHLYQTILATRYHHVAVCHSGSEAVARLVSHQGPAVVVLDYHLPDMTGIEVMATCRDLEHPVACMMVSADRLNDQEAGCGEAIRLTKPLGCQTLLQWTAKLVHKVQTAVHGEGPGDHAPENLLIGQSAAMQHLRTLIPRLAQSRSPLWLHGESGTGKELAARSVHYCSPRSSGPFVAVNCAAFPEALIESMLFGHVKGAFSGATRDHKGFFEAADQGTLFLDEVGDMPLPFQAKLLRALQTGTITPVGSTRDVRVDCRVITACHRDLAQSVREGAFREDLYYRLNVLSLALPPLRERQGDALMLADHLLESLAREERIAVCPLDEEARNWIQQHDWPGNVRELENRLRRALLLCDGKAITVNNLMLNDDERLTSAPPPSQAPSGVGIHFSPGRMTLRQIEDAAIEATLEACDGCIERAARQLGVAASTLHRRRRRQAA